MQTRKKNLNLQIKKGLTALVSALKGVAGQFSSMAQVDTLQYIDYHYATIGNRSLQRYRLKLTRSQEMDLLARLIRAKLNHQMDYRFFTQNCGSILFQVLGEGIQNPKLTDFSPWVAAPNLLLFELDRAGLIERVYPDFLSFWSKSYRAREWILAKIKVLQQQIPQLTWPGAKQLFADEEATRTQAVRQLFANSNQSPQVKKQIGKILLMFQQAELYYAWNEEGCLDYASRPKGEARKLYRQLAIEGDPPQVDIDQELNQWKLAEQKKQAQKGSGHTGYLKLSLGKGWQQEPREEKTPITTLQGSLLYQELGDRSYRSLGRSSSIELASFAFTKTQQQEITQASFQALRIHKIKEILQNTPSLIQGKVKMGIGLTALAWEQDTWSYLPYQTRLIEGEGRFNLVSSSHYDDFLLASIAIAWVQPWQRATRWNRRLLGPGGLLSFPVRLEGLVSLGSKNNLQIRPHLEQDLLFEQGELKLNRQKAGIKIQLRLWSGPEVEPQLVLDLNRKQEKWAQNKTSHQLNEVTLSLRLFFGNANGEPNSNAPQRCPDLENG